MCILVYLNISNYKRISKPNNFTTEKQSEFVIIDNENTGKILEEFVIDYKIINGYDVTYKINELDSVTFGVLDDSTLGVCHTVLTHTGDLRGKINLNNSIKANYTIHKIVLYHELGHWFGLGHGSCDIMCEELDKDMVNDIVENWYMDVYSLMLLIDKINR
jgi:hypothetical protein